MAHFLVLVDGEAGGWRVDREALTEAIRARWSDVEVDSTRRSEVRSSCWYFETENGPGEAYLHQDGTWTSGKRPLRGWRSSSAGSLRRTSI